MKSTVVVLAIIVVFGLLLSIFFVGKHRSFSKIDKFFNIPTESIESVKLYNNDFERILEKEIENPSKFLSQFGKIVKEHNTRIQENVAAATVYTDEIAVSTKEGIYKFKFIQPLSGKGLVEYTIENENQIKYLIDIDSDGAGEIRDLLKKTLGLIPSKENSDSHLLL